MIIQANKLLNWFDKEKRDFPWRRTNDPFSILLAEIMLRKTTSKQVSAIYSDFLDKYGIPLLLANASIEELEKVLKPLGIYRVRARQLNKLGKTIMKDFNNTVPNNYDELISLSGVSKYIANSLLCFAFHKRVPIVDANIARIYRRLKGNEKLTYKQIEELVKKDLPFERVSEYNWGLLDFAAKICRSKAPLCINCIFNDYCELYKHI